MSYDLLLKTNPLSGIPVDSDIVAVHESCKVIAAQTTGTLVSYRSPDGKFAKWFLENDAFPLEPETRTEFERFCSVKGIAPEPLTPDLALAFWTAKEGVDLASFSCPNDIKSVKTLYAALINLAKERGLRIFDPQAGREIDLNSPGATPPAW